MRPKTIAAVSAFVAGVLYSSVALSGFIGPNLRPITDQPAAPATKMVGRVEVTSGLAFNPHWDCLGEETPFTSYSVRIGSADTVETVLASLREAGVPPEGIYEVITNLSTYGTGEIAVGSFGLMHHPCPSPPPAPPTTIEGPVWEASLNALGLDLLVESSYQGRITVPVGVRIDVGERVRVHRQDGFTGDRVQEVDTLEVLDQNGKVRFMYKP